ncbi:hypothetical protein ABFS82_11G020300 [Erythranthe guttata]
MDKNLLHMMVTLLLLLLFVSVSVSGAGDGRILSKRCKKGMRTRCYPKEKCEPRACAIFCSRFEDFECNYGCVCLSDCGPHNSTTLTPPPHNHPPPPLPILISFRRCMV